MERALGNKILESATTHQMAAAYESLGDYEKALDYYNQALELRRATNDLHGQANTLRGIGKIYFYLGEKQTGFGYVEQALKLNRKTGDRRNEAENLGVLSTFYIDAQDQGKSLECANKALEIYLEIKDLAGEANAQESIGDAYLLTHDDKALAALQRALELNGLLNRPEDQAHTFYKIARHYLLQGELENARYNIESALSLIELQRTKTLERNLRQTFFSVYRNYYQFYIELLMRMHERNPKAGIAAQALQASERERARGLLELISEGNVDINQGIDPQLLARNQLLTQQIEQETDALTKLIVTNSPATQIQAIKKEIDESQENLQKIGAEIRRRSPNYAAIAQPQPLDITEIQRRVLDSDTMLLEYALAPQRSFLWVVTTDSVNVFTLPGEDEIDNAAKRLYTLLALPALTNRNLKLKNELSNNEKADVNQSETELIDAIKSLSQIILAPVAYRLEKKRTLVVADGALQYIPFGVLMAPQKDSDYRPFIIDHEIINLPSASTLSVIRDEQLKRAMPDKTIAIFADPVFDQNDDRLKGRVAHSADIAINKTVGENGERLLKYIANSTVSKNGEQGKGNNTQTLIPRLPFTRQEAESIIALVPAINSSSCLKATDCRANKMAAASGDISRYRYVHFATHGYFDSEQPELSAMVLSMVDEEGKPQNGFLTLRDIFNLHLTANLVVLSACETGLGKEIKGEGLVGLTRGFMYAGAARVVVSLWSVNDKATAELMTKFYTHMLKDNMRPAAALRAAQVEMFQSEKYQAPFYWAPFILQGEYK
jgi:CHAT domain-containing protein